MRRRSMKFCTSSRLSCWIWATRRADLGHPLHRFAVAPLVGKPLGREELERDRQREVVAAPPLAEVDDALAAVAQQPPQPQMLGPAQLGLVRSASGSDREVR